MRQDLRQRQKHIKRLHQSIEKYQQSPATKKAIEKATIQLEHTIQYKYRKSQVNNNYVFPRNSSISDDQYDQDVEIVDLKMQGDFLSKDLSIAEQPQSNTVYISQKTVLAQQKYSPFSKRPDGKSRLKIKVIKKKNNFDTCQAVSKLDRLKTQHIQTNFSTSSYKHETLSKTNQHDSVESKNWLAPPMSDANRIRKKLKISTRLQSQHSNFSPAYANLTMKTEYTTHGNKRKQGKQNQRTTINPHVGQKYYLTHSSSKKIQPFGYKLHINVKSTINKTKDIKQSIENCKSKVGHKSFQNLKSIKLGHNKSSQKIKSIRGLHA